MPWSTTCGPSSPKVGAIGGRMTRRRPRSVTGTVGGVADGRRWADQIAGLGKPAQIVHHPVEVGHQLLLGPQSRRRRQLEPVRGTLGGGEHVLILLRYPDRSDPWHTRGGLPLQMRTHHILLTIRLVERDDRRPMCRREHVDPSAKRGADLLHDRRRRDREPQVARHEHGHLTAHLQRRHVAVEIDPIQTLDIQAGVPLKQIVHRQRSHTPP